MQPRPATGLRDREWSLAFFGARVWAVCCVFQSVSCSAVFSLRETRFFPCCLKIPAPNLQLRKALYGYKAKILLLQTVLLQNLLLSIYNGSKFPAVRLTLIYGQYIELILSSFISAVIFGYSWSVLAQFSSYQVHSLTSYSVTSS